MINNVGSISNVISFLIVNIYHGQFLQRIKNHILLYHIRSSPHPPPPPTKVWGCLIDWRKARGHLNWNRSGKVCACVVFWPSLPNDIVYVCVYAVVTRCPYSSLDLQFLQPLSNNLSNNLNYFHHRSHFHVTSFFLTHREIFSPFFHFIFVQPLE